MNAVYPGSFNPFHVGHGDVLNKALLAFDNVTIAIGKNPEKNPEFADVRAYQLAQDLKYFGPRVHIATFDGLLTDFVRQNGYDAVVRGLRNTIDFENEKSLLYQYEDSGLSCPVFYIIADRELTHISSTLERAKAKFKK